MSAPAWWEPRAAYIHVPFCAHHCGYCDFAVVAGADHLMAEYVQALISELKQLGQPRPVQTIFIGGGTPTYLPLDLLEELLSAVQQWFPLTAETPETDCSAKGSTKEVDTVRQPREFSIEATPESLDEHKLALLKTYGVTRLSLGVQSFHPAALQVLERRHTSTIVPEVVAWARRHQLVVSLDLIFGVPGTTLDDWNTDLESALALDPDHLSTYGLTYEKGTPLWKQWHRGLIRAVDEDTEAAMYERAIERLTAAGFEHYEVSNFARPGYRCRHNETYWANEAYYGCGLGAVRYVHGVREGNVRDVRQYIRRLQAGQSVTAWREELPPWERACETLILQLRRRQGITRSHFREQTGYTLNELLGPALSEAIDDGLLEDDGQAIRLSRQGLLVADTVLTDLWSAACRNQARRVRRLPIL